LLDILLVFARRQAKQCPDKREEHNMDLLLLLLIIIAVLALTGWGYGTYTTRAAPAGTTEVVTAPAWVNPVGLLGLLAVIGVIAMLVTGWRPLVIIQ
jgi:hypothetical protein